MTNQRTILDVFGTEVREFSVYSNVRAIPSGIDGFKPSHRKVIFGMVSKGIGEEKKVSQWAGIISDVSGYRHGEISLQETIIGLAQNYVGSNNINYLDPNGQFGSRISNSSAAARYIFTRFNSNFRKVFHKDDDLILEQAEDDGEKVEPIYYLPVIPNVLVNGVSGMGTGFASSILPYNPADLKRECLAAITKSGKRTPLIPWYRGFTGSVQRTDANQTVITGTLEIVNTSTIKISEIPLNITTFNYRKELVKLEDSGLIKDFQDNSTEQKIEFIITCSRETTKIPYDELLKKFKLVSRETENITVWDENGRLMKYENVDDLLTWFVEFRLEKYEDRRLAVIAKMEKDLFSFTEKQRFIRFYLDNVQWFKGSQKKELYERLINEGFAEPEIYLAMRIYNLTGDKITELQAEVDELTKELEELRKTTAAELYKKDLKALQF